MKLQTFRMLALLTGVGMDKDSYIVVCKDSNKSGNVMILTTR